MTKRRKLIAILVGLVIAVYTCFLEGITILMTDFNIGLYIMTFVLYAYIGLFEGSSLFYMITRRNDESKNIYICFKGDYIMQYCLFSFIRAISLENTCVAVVIFVFKILGDVKNTSGVLVTLTIIGVIGIVIMIKAHKETVRCWEKIHEHSES